MLSWFRQRRITVQFLLAGGFLVVAATALAGYVLSGIVQRNALQATASATALFMDAMTSSLVQELADRSTLPAAERSQLDRLFEDPGFRERFPYLEIWHPDGIVAYSNSPDLIGRSFTLPPGARLALTGQIASTLTDLSASEHTARNWTEKYLEIYSPLREAETGRVIAIAEIHEDSAKLQGTLSRLRFQSWMIVLSVGVAIMAGLYGVVASGARQIDDQRRRLDLKVAELENASALNQSLRTRIQGASARLSEMNEHFLRRLGAELHDGPAQLVGFAILHLEQLRRETDPQKRRQLADTQEQTLKEAQSEIRDIAKGLLLPDIMELDLQALIARVVAIHEARTGSHVSLERAGTLPNLSPAAKICAFRFVQEGLHNAFRHGGGVDQRVLIDVVQRSLKVSVLNRAVANGGGRSAEGGLGLLGMRERVESLGGTLKLEAVGGDTKLTMELDDA